MGKDKSQKMKKKRRRRRRRIRKVVQDVKALKGNATMTV